MQLHDVKPKTKYKTHKRVGRGGKRGTYSGKGQKGQKSRSGHVIRPAERDLIQRLPKLRGFKFKPLKAKPVSVSLDVLTSKIKDGVINKEVLVAAGLVKKTDKDIKILGFKKQGEQVKSVLQITGLQISKKLKEAVEKAGGKVS